MKPGGHSKPPWDRGLRAVALEMRRKEPGASDPEDAVPSCCIHIRAARCLLFSVFLFPVKMAFHEPLPISGAWVSLRACPPALPRLCPRSRGLAPTRSLRTPARHPFTTPDSGYQSFLVLPIGGF